MRVRHKGADRRIKECLDLRRSYAAPGKNARQELRQSVMLDNGERLRRSARIQTRAPCSAAGGPLDVQKISPARIGGQRQARGQGNGQRSGQGDTHGTSANRS
jgi:hypothetical protein